MLANAFRGFCIVGAVAFLAACGGGKDKDINSRYFPVDLEETGHLQVNSYLWRAAMDTLAFMPFESTDSAGGVLITEWYSNPSRPNEQTKVVVRILDYALRADAVKVAVHRQVRTDAGSWIDAPVRAGTALKLEDAILLRAREIRIANVTK